MKCFANSCRTMNNICKDMQVCSAGTRSKTYLSEIECFMQLYFSLSISCSRGIYFDFYCYRQTYFSPRDGIWQLSQYKQLNRKYCLRLLSFESHNDKRHVSLTNFILRGLLKILLSPSSLLKA